VPSRSVQSHLNVLLKTIQETTPGSDTDMAPTFHDLAERIARRGLVIVLSDLLDDPQEVLRGLRQFRHRGHEVVVFHLLDPREIDLDFDKETRFFDLEDPEQMLTTQPWLVRREYGQMVEEMVETYRRGCAEARIDYALISTATPFDVALSRYLVQRRKMG
jgi:hypothetical protein